MFSSCRNYDRSETFGLLFCFSRSPADFFFLRYETYDDESKKINYWLRINNEYYASVEEKENALSMG